MLPAFYLNCLNSLAPGIKLFLTGVNFTKKKGFGQFSLAAYWKRKYRGKSQDEGWYILTNLSSLSAAINRPLAKVDFRPPRPPILGGT
jgi:hypothetical protein